MILSLRQASIQFGMSKPHILELTRVGALAIRPGSTKLRPKYSSSQFDALVFGTHYVICMACGSWCGQITTRHLSSCSHMELKDYMVKWPNAPIMCLIVNTKKIKTIVNNPTQAIETVTTALVGRHV